MSMAWRSATPFDFEVHRGFGDEYHLRQYINKWEESLVMGEEAEDADWLVPELAGENDMEGYVRTCIIWESRNGRQWTTWLPHRVSPSSLFPHRWVPGPLRSDVEQQRQRDEDNDEDRRREEEEEDTESLTNLVY
ncbi:hypothetical protein C8J57DRAFT_1227257 [Mycena rebaudengoi]|nr:hypothetical protein C8J57DRAFT_1227257 [Mycena rebaudengoi]